MAEQKDQVIVKVCSIESCNGEKVAEELMASLNGQTIGRKQVSVEKAGCIGFCGLRQRVDVSINGVTLRYAERGYQSRNVQELGDSPAQTIRAAVESYQGN